MIRIAGNLALAVAFLRCLPRFAGHLPAALVRGECFPAGRALYVGIASGLAFGAHVGF